MNELVHQILCHFKGDRDLSKDFECVESQCSKYFVYLNADDSTIIFLMFM